MSTINCGSRIYINLISDYILKKSLIQTIALKGKENYAKLFWNIIISIFNILIHSPYSTMHSKDSCCNMAAQSRRCFSLCDSFIILTFCYCNVSSASFANKTCTFTGLFLFFLPTSNVSFF